MRSLRFYTYVLLFVGGEKKHWHFAIQARSSIRTCLAQLNFISEVVFLENNFINNFIGEAKLFWKKCLYAYIKERNGGERCNKLLFSALSQLMSLWEEKKNSFIHEAVLEISV